MSPLRIFHSHIYDSAVSATNTTAETLCHKTGLTRAASTAIILRAAANILAASAPTATRNMLIALADDVAIRNKLPDQPRAGTPSPEDRFNAEAWMIESLIAEHYETAVTQARLQ